MVAEFKSGQTLEQIGVTHGITRERVRQLLKREGLTGNDGGQHIKSVRRRAGVHASKARVFEARWGHSRAVHRSLPKSARSDFASQRNAARRDGIPWSIRFGEWWQVWAASGLWSKRGIGTGRYMLGRIDRRGPFALDNVEIREHTVNSRLPRVMSGRFARGDA